MNTDGGALNIFGAITRYFILYRKLVIAVVISVTALLGYFAVQVQTNTSNEYYFLPGDEFLTRYDDFKKTFGSDEYTYAVFTFDDALSPESLRTIQAFSKAVEDEVPYVSSIQSIISADAIVSDELTITVEPFIDMERLEDTDYLRSKQKEALKNNTYKNFLVSEDRKHAGVLVEHPMREGDDKYRAEICETIRAIGKRPRFRTASVKFVGPTILDTDVDATMIHESRFFMAISATLIFLIILLSFRRFSLVLAPFIVIGVTVIWVVGLMSIFSFPITMMSLVLPSVIVVVGCGDAIHYISEYVTLTRENSHRQECLIKAAELTGMPCLFTSLTTMVGFGSLMAMELRPGREMGLFAAIGVVLAFVATFTLLPTLLSFGRNIQESTITESRLRTLYRDWLKQIASVSVNYKSSIVSISLFLFILSLVGLTKIEVSADFLRVFDESTRIRKEYEYVDRHLGGTSSFQVVVDSQKTDGLFDPIVLRDFDRFISWLEARPEVASTQSILDVFKELRKVGHDGDEKFYSVPESKQEAAQLFLLYEMGGAEEIEKILTDERDRARVAVRTQSISTAASEKLLQDTEKWAQANLQSVKIRTTGMAPLFVRMIHFITRSQIRSFGIAFVFVSLCMVLVFRSIPLGILAMVPNIFPVVLTFGVMGWAGITLNLGTVMITSIAIGIAVDDSIHYVSHFRRHRASGQNLVNAIEETTRGVGVALLNTSLVLALGFCVFGLSDISHLVNFGTLTALAVVLALLADFLLLPAVLLSLSPQSDG
ncbi:MAG: MMPL family transporter [Myxococcota bacterium]|nr:MMPL family transporter [Myxococcota bacterium]